MTDPEPYAPRWVASAASAQNLTPVPPTRRPDRLHTELASVFEGYALESRSEPAVGEYRDGGPGLPHRVKIKVGQQQARLRAQ